MTTLSRNIELKANLADIAAARAVAEALAAKRLADQEQTDTYFVAPYGRLKLRQIAGGHAELIWYARADSADPRPSDYRRVPVGNPETLKRALAAALDVSIVVHKHREIYVWQGVRIHLDRVAGLGDFLEFEAVVGPGMDDALGRRRLDELAERFAIGPDCRLAGSYADLLARRQAQE